MKDFASNYWYFAIEIKASFTQSAASEFCDL